MSGERLNVKQIIGDVIGIGVSTAVLVGGGYFLYDGFQKDGSYLDCQQQLTKSDHCDEMSPAESQAYARERPSSFAAHTLGGLALGIGGGMVLGGYAMAFQEEGINRWRNASALTSNPDVTIQ